MNIQKINQDLIINKKPKYFRKGLAILTAGLCIGTAVCSKDYDTAKDSYGRAFINIAGQKNTDNLSNLNKQKDKLTNEIKNLLKKNTKSVEYEIFKKEQYIPAQKKLKGVNIDFKNYKKILKGEKSKNDNETKIQKLENKTLKAEYDLILQKKEFSDLKKDYILQRLLKGNSQSILKKISAKLDKLEKIENKIQQFNKDTDSSKKDDEISIFNNLDNTTIKASKIIKNSYISSSIIYPNTEQQFIYVTDKNGRLVIYKADYPGNSKDSLTTINYDDKGGKTETIETIGRTIVKKYDNKNNVVKIDYSAKETGVDGEIGNSMQQNIGDCWLLSGVNALKSTKKGAEIIKNSIRKNPGGSVTVFLNGVNKAYTFSADQIKGLDYQNSNQKYAKGDIDMNLIEMAVTEYRLEGIKNLDVDLIKRGKSVNDPLSGGFGNELIRLLVKEGTYMQADILNNNDIYTDKFINVCLNSKTDENESVILFASFSEDETICNLTNKCSNGKDFNFGNILTGHEYHITKTDKNNVYIVNPWNSSVEIPYPKDKFLKNLNFLSITLFDSNN